MEDTKRLGIPFLIILFSALAVKLINRFFTSSFTPTLLTFLIVCSLFLFGMVLNKSRKRRNPAVFKKVLAILVMVLLMLMQMGYFTLPLMKDAFDFFGVDAFYINMIYIFCGYLFAD